MNARRFAEVARRELAFNLTRPMLWILGLLVILQAWGLSAGTVRISSGDTTVGGTDAFITSQFSQAFMLSLSILAFYAFFVAVGAGMTVIRDEESKVLELLHATLLTPAEYVWGKFTGVMAAFMGVLGLQLAASIFFNHALADAASSEFIGPLHLSSYLVPAAVFGLPSLLFLGGTAFAVGERTRRPILVFFLPVAVLLATLTFLISWSPSWLSPAINRLLMLVDPSGFRWLNETWLEVDRGVEFYNTAAIGFDASFVLSRLGFVLLGLAAVFGSQRHFARGLSGPVEGGAIARLMERIGARLRRREAPVTASRQLSRRRPLEGLAMMQQPPGFLAGFTTVLRAEVHELLTRPGLYLFVPLIMLQVTSNLVTTVVAFDAPALLTPGTMAVGTLNTLNLLVCFLLLFYMVESLQREFSSGFAPIFYATPARTGAILLGKALGTSLVGVIVLGAVLLVCLAVLAVQRLAGSPVPVAVTPFLLSWGTVLVPTFVLWTAFVTAVFAVSRSRYLTYAAGIGVVVLTMREILVGEGLSWLTNWMGWSAVIWSDMGLFPLNGRPLAWNRALVLAVATLLVVLAGRWFARREWDPQRILQRLRPRAVAGAALQLAPAWIPPVALAVMLSLQIGAGFESEAEERLQKDYWRRNLATWRDAKDPVIGHVDLAVELEPADRWMSVEGSYRLTNLEEEVLRTWSITPGRWESLRWTLDGVPFEPEDRAGLHVFDRALAPGESVELGFAYEAVFPRGFNESGGGAAQFILDSGVVLTSFGPTWVPTVGYLEGIGVDEDNRYEPREYPDDFYEGETPSGFGNNGPPYTTRIAVSLPAEYRANSVGVAVSDEVVDGRRSVVWESDHPVTFFNLVAGRWDVREGDGIAIYHHPEHTYNIDEMSRALEASRRYYSEWFYPYPWELLKLSEFPTLATYAQGFPTNITFSEGIGFLTRNDPRARAAFLVTAHEAAHQWWGNLLTPGQGPGANILSEGMSHYSTMMLVEQELGVGHRIEVSKRFESRYANGRQVDSERPLVKIDGSRAGDTVVTYEKGGWVAWMLMDLMGRDAMLAGLREFIAVYRPSRDYPVLQDLVAVLRSHARDAAAFDAFVEQWFFDVVMPEYRISEARLVEEPGAEGPRWRVSATITNVGSGRAEVTVAATDGVRFPDLAAEAAGSLDADPPTGMQSPDYREARTSVVLGAGESATIDILADFEPSELVIDPDVRVLQLRRERARAPLTTTGS